MYVEMKHSKAAYYRVEAKVLKTFYNETKEKWEEGSKLARLINIWLSKTLVLSQSCVV